MAHPNPQTQLQWPCLACPQPTPRWQSTPPFPMPSSHHRLRGGPPAKVSLANAVRAGQGFPQEGMTHSLSLQSDSPALKANLCATGYIRWCPAGRGLRCNSDQGLSVVFRSGFSMIISDLIIIFLIKSCLFCKGTIRTDGVCDGSLSASIFIFGGWDGLFSRGGPCWHVKAHATLRKYAKRHILATMQRDALLDGQRRVVRSCVEVYLSPGGGEAKV